MNLFVQTTLAVSAVLAVVAIALGTYELRRIREFLKTGLFRVQQFPATSVSLEMGVLRSQAGYAIYVFRQGQWVLESDLSKPGYEAVPPGIPGSFEGQAIKKESGLKGKG